MSVLHIGNIPSDPPRHPPFTVWILLVISCNLLTIIIHSTRDLDGYMGEGGSSGVL